MRRFKSFLFHTPQHWFLVLALFFGTLYTFIIPPFQAPDETNHFFRLYHLSEGHLMGITTVDHRLGGELPESLQEIYIPFSRLRYNYGARVSPDSLRKAAAVPLNPGKRIFTDFANVGYYAPFAYLPGALVFAGLRLLEIPPLFMLYAGRLTGLFIWIGMLFVVIRDMPYHRWTIMFCALLPASLFLHCSLTGDTLINALAFFLIARLTRLIYDEQKSFTTGQGLLIALIGAVITLSKVVYAPLIALCWIIPAGKFRSKAHYRTWCAGLMIFHIALVAWWYGVAGDKFIPYDQYHPSYRDAQQINPGVDPAAQLDLIFHHPLRYLSIVAASLWESLPATAAHYAGKFGWEKNYLAAPVIALLLLTLPALGAFENESPARLTWTHRFTFLAIAGVMTTALATVLYLQWHPVGAKRIISFQGRYFIPILPLLWLSLKQTRFPVRQTVLINWSVAIIFISLCSGIWAAISRYWSFGHL